MLPCGVGLPLALAAGEPFIRLRLRLIDRAGEGPLGDRLRLLDCGGEGPLGVIRPEPLCDREGGGGVGLGRNPSLVCTAASRSFAASARRASILAVSVSVTRRNSSLAASRWWFASPRACTTIRLLRRSACLTCFRMRLIATARAWFASLRTLVTANETVCSAFARTRAASAV